MAGKPTITLVGAGNLAQALGPALRRAGYQIESVIARARKGSLVRARVLAKKLGARASNKPEATGSLLWFCVPDSEIIKAAASFANSVEQNNQWEGRFAFHSSGALTSQELSALQKCGVAVASVHPLMTFVRKSRPSLAGASFAIEGDSRAVRLAKQIVRDLGGEPCSIRKKDKALYHAWGTFASPLLTSLLAVTEEIALAAGMTRQIARKRLLPILQRTISNYGRLGAPDSFSGPLVRGDAATVQRHLKKLQRLPIARDVYVTLATSALAYLPTKNRKAVQAALKITSS